MADVPHRVSWRALLAMVRHSAPQSAFYRLTDPDLSWDLKTELAAQQADALAWLVWSKTPDGQNNRKRPKPFPRPNDLHHPANAAALAKAAGVVDATGNNGPADGRTFGTASMTLDETRKWMGW